MRLSLLMPWALPLAFAGLIFAWFFDSSIRRRQRRLARARRGPIWLNTPDWAFAAICLTIIWKTSSFMALILLAGLQTIPHGSTRRPRSTAPAAGSSSCEITLPLLKPAIVVALIFRTITAIQTFDIPYAMTRGGPGNSTETLAMYIHNTTIDFLDLGYGSALAVVMFALSMLRDGLVYLIRRLRGDSDEP